MIRPVVPILFVTTLVLLGCADGNNNDKKKVATCSGTQIQPERLFLQQLGPDSVIIKWRGNVDGDVAADNVCFGTDMQVLPEESRTAATVTATGHSEALISGLEPDTTYYYSVGGAGTVDASHSFRTAPVPGRCGRVGAYSSSV